MAAGSEVGSAAGTPPHSAATGATPVPAAPPAEPQLSAAELAALLARGDTLVSIGDVASARLFYERAANAGDALAAVRLGETFDPGFLDRARLRAVRPDLRAAVSWYRRARDLGVPGAEILLKSLESQ
jgi:TPR repeat protein